MSNAIFPTLPGLTWGVTKTPTWSTAIQRARSGVELRGAYYQRPIWKFGLSFEFLRKTVGYTEFEQLLAFFNARMGAFDSFLFQDPSDYIVTDQPFGVGDGVTRTFALVHTIYGWTEPIGFSSNEQVHIDGVLQSWPSQFGADGVNVTFTTPPGVGAVLTWSGTFYYRVRFEKDMLEFDQFMKDLWQLKKCELMGVI